MRLSYTLLSVLLKTSEYINEKIHSILVRYTLLSKQRTNIILKITIYAQQIIKKYKQRKTKHKLDKCEFVLTGSVIRCSVSIV